MDSRLGALPDERRNTEGGPCCRSGSRGASLHEAEPALRRIDVSEATEPHVFVRRMVDRGVARELATDRLIGSRQSSI
jgi:hypothetical protein